MTNSSCNTSCDPGYELSGSPEHTCQPNGSWTSPPITCKSKPCPELDQPDNGYVRLPCTGRYGSRCSLQCIYGFEVENGNSSFSCDLNDDDQDTVQWSDYGTCESKLNILIYSTLANHYNLTNLLKVFTKYTFYRKASM